MPEFKERLQRHIERLQELAEQVGSLEQHVQNLESTVGGPALVPTTRRQSGSEVHVAAPKFETLCFEDPFLRTGFISVNNGFWYSSNGWNGTSALGDKQLCLTDEGGSTITFEFASDGCPVLVNICVPPLPHMNCPGQVLQFEPGLKGKICEPQNLLALSGGREWAQIIGLIERGCIALVRGEYFEDCLTHARPFSMRQEIPDHYIWNSSDAVNMWAKCGRQFLLIISYCWLSRDHPDPECFHLPRIACIVKKLRRHWHTYGGLTDIAVAIDFCSLWQRSATGGLSGLKEDQFREGLGGFNKLYAHEHVTSIKLKDVPRNEQRTYEDRGWTLSESCLIDAKPGYMNKLTFEDFHSDSELTEGRAFFRLFGAAKARPPLSPEAFEKQLEERKLQASAKGLRLFTAGGDNSIVPKLYRESFEAMKLSKHFSYNNAMLGDEGASMVCAVLSGTLVEVLDLQGNNITEKGTLALSQALRTCTCLKYLDISRNYIRSASVKHIHELVEHPPIRMLAIDSIPQADEKLRKAWVDVGKDPRFLLVWLVQHDGTRKMSW